MATLKINESSRGKVPSCYVNKTFALMQTTKVGDFLPSINRGQGGLATWDAYEAMLKNGKKLHIIRFDTFSDNQWFVRKEGCHAGTWLYNVEFSE